MNMGESESEGGGDCQFLALAYHLGGLDHTEVRRRVVQEIVENKDIYIKFCEEWDHPNPPSERSYVARGADPDVLDCVTG